MSKLQQKMQQYEVTPPAGVWDKIAASLDESQTTQGLSTRLYGIEIAPPVSAWDKIKDSLVADKAGEPKTRRVIPFFRYAVAASIIGLLLFAGFKLFSGNKTASDVAKTSPVIENTSPAIGDEQKSIQPPDTNSLAADEARDNAALEESKQTFASLDMSITSRIKQKTRNYISAPLALAGFAKELNPENTYQELHCTEIAQPSVTYSDNRDNLTNRYLTLLTPDGNIIRMSKKWSNLLCCVAGEEQDEDCKYQLKKWREKMAGTIVAPSPGNFLDIINLVSSLQENNH